MNENVGAFLMRAEDIDAVHAIECDTFAIPWSRASFEHDIKENPCARYLVLRRGEEILGYAGMWLVLDEAHITNVAIRRDERGKGLGRMLMTALIRLAADSGMQWMGLEVRAGNEAAQNLYRSLGFFRIGKRPRYYEDNGEDAILMALTDLPEGDPDHDPFLASEESGEMTE